MTEYREFIIAVLLGSRVAAASQGFHGSGSLERPEQVQRKLLALARA